MALAILIAAAAPLLMLKNQVCPLSRTISVIKKKQPAPALDINAARTNLLQYLKLRKDSLALIEIEKVLSVKPDDSTALWGKAEALRRNYQFKESEELLNLVLSKYPCHASSLISLSYIRYHDNRFEDALELLRRVLSGPELDRENEALAYMLIGSINAKKASLGGFLSKVVYATRIRSYFEKAKNIAPDLSEVHLGLGSFYLLAPWIVGGSLDKAIKELEIAVRLTPDFATANMRLAQAYNKKGDLGKYNFYLQRAKELDPDNELLKEFRD